MKRALVVLVLLPGLAWADTVYLEGGRTINGVVVERTDTTLVIEIGPGRVGLPLSRVKKVVPSKSPLAEYRERAQQLQNDDVAGWLRLADWAEGADLKTQAREACEQVLRSDPQNAAAQRCLGRVLQDGQWMSFEDSQRARGLVQYGSQWVTPAEHERLIASEDSASLARRAQEEADARVREAEARAREAEARARAAENEADGDAGGSLYWPPFGGGVTCTGACAPGCPGSCEPHDGHARPPGTNRPQPPATSPTPAPARVDRAVPRPTPPRGAAVQPPPAPGAQPRPPRTKD